MSSFDALIQRLRKHTEESHTECAARFVVTKLSWRGSYRRVLAITASAVVTQFPDSLAVTNSWAFAGDHDLAGVEVGGEHADGGVFVLQLRRDKKASGGGGRGGGGAPLAGGAAAAAHAAARSPPAPAPSRRGSRARTPSLPATTARHC
jgi:hypothetical protein